MERRELKIQMCDTLNRAITFTAYIKKKALHLCLLTSKRTSALECQYDTKCELISEGTVSVRLFRNLTNCSFCNIFFNLENVENDDLDYRGRFLGVKEEFKDVLLQFSAEKLELRTKTDLTQKDNSNYLTITGWKIFDCEEDIAFFFAQRKIYNVIKRCCIIRTLGVQICTPKGFKLLQRYEEHLGLEPKEVKEESDLPEYFKQYSEKEDSILEGEIFGERDKEI